MSGGRTLRDESRQEIATKKLRKGQNYVKYKLPQKARWLILILLVIVVVGIFLGLVVRVLELFAGLVIPVAGGAVLAWFAYKLFLQPVFRQRKLDRIREYRARREDSHFDDNQQL